MKRRSVAMLLIAVMIAAGAHAATEKPWKKKPKTKPQAVSQTVTEPTPRCAPSAQVKVHDYPGARVIPTTNNLILPTGKSIPAEGQPLIITGRVLDKNCMPVPEAIVELWQAGPFGRWLLAERDELASPLPTFAGAGRTYTNMDGEFSFITAFPAPARYKAPNVNIKVKAEKLPTYNSALFFGDDRRNDGDGVYGKLTGKTRSDTTIRMQEGPNGDLVGVVEIVLSGKAPYRTY